MKNLVLIECDQGEMAAGATAAVAAVQSLGPIVALAYGENAAKAAADIARLPGVEQVLVASGEGSAPRAEALAPVVVACCRQLECTQVVAAAGAQARAILPRVAALLGLMAVSDVVKVIDARTVVRPVHAGAALMTVKLEDAVRIFSVRPSSFEQMQPSASAAAAPIVTIEVPPAAVSAQVVERRRPSQDAGVELIGARVVVSGGRGVGSAEGFERLRPLAQALGAAVGASRAAVDAGYAAADAQVGQTGKSVAPDLYVALGISGAVQHWAGMKDSRTIVAVNKDPEAPIFQFADYALVGDLFEVLPVLERAVSDKA
jgi:electron transfer flavoprotein alpha subunit